jgi:hypothetical protein
MQRRSVQTVPDVWYLPSEQEVARSDRAGPILIDSLPLLAITIVGIVALDVGTSI